MLKISKLADYAMVIMDYLASNPGERYSASAIAEQTPITLPTVSKVMKLLHEAGLVASTRGASGGYQLTCLPNQISVAQVITAVDGKPAMTECSQGDNICSIHNKCGLRSNWQFINQIVFNVLNSVSLADMNRPLEKRDAQ